MVEQRVADIDVESICSTAKALTNDGLKFTSYCEGFILLFHHIIIQKEYRRMGIGRSAYTTYTCPFCFRVN